MNITISTTKTPAHITILQLEGKLDGANYEILIEEAEKVYDDGVRDLILDLSKLTFISSSGLAALHQVALLFRGDDRPGQDVGWAAFHAIDRYRDGGTQEHVKLFSPSEPVRDVLDITGFSSLFEIYTDLPRAKTSFSRVDSALESRLP